MLTWAMFAVGGVLALLGTMILRGGKAERETLEQTAFCPCGEAKVGRQVRLTGQVWGETTVESPLSERPCVFYLLEYQEYDLELGYGSGGFAASPTLTAGTDSEDGSRSSSQRFSVPVWGIRDETGFIAIDLDLNEPLGMAAQSSGSPEAVERLKRILSHRSMGGIGGIVERRVELGAEIEAFGWVRELNGQLWLDGTHELEVYIGGERTRQKLERSVNWLGIALIGLGVFVAAWGSLALL